MGDCALVFFCLMGLMKAKYLILLLLLVGFSTAFAAVDVNDIYIQGDSTLMGMKIESSYFAENAFLIETTGARFEYVKGQLKIYQGLDKTNRRLLSTVTFDNEPNFIKVKASDDHILLWSKDLNLGIYGNSTLIVSPKNKQQLKCRGNFKPDYEGRYKGELLLIDDLGGMEIYPQRYEAGYKIKKIELGKQDWIADYELKAGERVMIAAFPGREFDWEKSFRMNIIGTGGRATAEIYPDGELPPDAVIREWSRKFDVMYVSYGSLYKESAPGGPYMLKNKAEFERLVRTAHRNGMKVVAYSSLFYHYRRTRDIESYYEEMKLLHDKYAIDGLYVDGLLFDQEPYWIDDKIVNFEMMRRLRRLFGSEGLIFYHGTSLGSPVATIPNVDSYCDVTVYGEGVAFRSVKDPYVRYQVRKYGISNTIGIWLTDNNPNSIGYAEIVDAVIEMNCREWWGDATFNQKFNARFRYYLKRFGILKKAYLTDKQHFIQTR